MITIKINPTRQRGQSLIAGLFLSVLAISGVVLMYNTGQSAITKMNVVNAADAAAYSGGIWTARQLNYMAYTNRAMIANHVAVGHLVSYVSWIRYVEQSLSNLHSYTFWIPYVGQAIGTARNVSEYYRQSTEYFSSGYIPVIDNLNRVLSASQRVAIANLNPDTIQAVMNATASDYGNVSVNTQDVFEPNTSSALSISQIGSEQQAILRFTQEYSPNNDEDRIQNLARRSLDKSEAWVRGNRGWRICLYGTCSRIPGNIRSRKTGRSYQVQGTAQRSNTYQKPFLTQFGNNDCTNTGGDDSNGLDWYARDKIKIEIARIRRFRVRWRTLYETCTDATAKEFHNTYAGIHTYRALRNQERADHSLSITAFTSTPVSEVRPHQFTEKVNNPRLDVKHRSTVGSNIITGVARAEIYHAPPEVSSLLARSGEYANLYNPFWQVNLSVDQIHEVLSTVTGL